MQRLERFASVLFGGIKDSSEDLRFLAPGQVERLVREGRTPFRIGIIGSPDSGVQANYQIPPRGHNPKDVDHKYLANGAAVFIYKDGSYEIGSTHALTEEQAQVLEDRIAAEKERISQS